MTESHQKALDDRIQEWLACEGYPLEFRAAREFSSSRFTIHQGFFFIDPNTKTPREIDLIADANFEDDNLLLRLTHLVECKWTAAKPWIVFLRDRRIAPSACVAQTLGSELGRALLWARAGDKRLHVTSAFSTPRNPGFGGRQAFSQGADFVYATLQSLSAAAVTRAESYSHSFDSHGRGIAVIIFPTIVIEGRLFSCFLNKEGKFRVKETGTVRVHWRGAEKWPYNVTIDIVTADYLPKFVTSRAAEMPRLAEVFLPALKSLRTAFKELDPSLIDVAPGSRGYLGLPPALAHLREAAAKRTERNDQRDNEDPASNPT